MTCPDKREANETRVAFITLATDHSMKGKTSPQQLKAVGPWFPVQLAIYHAPDVSKAVQSTYRLHHCQQMSRLCP